MIDVAVLKVVKEGLFLYEHGVPPYDGGVCHQVNPDQYSERELIVRHRYYLRSFRCCHHLNILYHSYSH